MARTDLLPLLALVASCGDHPDAGLSPSDRPSETPNFARISATQAGFSVDPTLLTVPTYDGTGQAVHPDVVAFDQSWHGAKYWLTMTPYAQSNQTLENPSILMSNDGLSVSVPAGLKNPIVQAPKSAADYNSESRAAVRAAVGPARALLSFRREEDEHHPHGDVARRRVMDVASRAVLGAVAQSSVADVAWASSVPTDLSIPGYNIWHIKARWIAEKSEYWMVLSAFPAGKDCGTDDLFFARSTDGTHWTVYADPIVRHEDRAWTAGAVYRSSFLYDASTDALNLWISARDVNGAWHIGYAKARYASLLDALVNHTLISPRPLVAFRAKTSGLAGEDQP